MQTENHKEESKVVSLFDKARESSASKEIEAKKAEEDFDFETIVRRNMENKARMNKERSKANRGVIRSYRLKN